MGARRGTYRVFVANPEGRRSLLRPRLDGRIILKWILEKWINLFQDRVRWWAVVNAVMNLRVPQNAGNFLTV
jgi:hypothetical protein